MKTKKPELLETKDYSIFKLLEKNRGIKSARVKTIASSIEEIDMTDCKPVIVNEKMEIIDGQTRFEACKELGLPVYYIKKNLNGLSDRAMILLNVAQSNWTIDEYVEHYILQGKGAYQDIADCRNKYKVHTSTAIAFVTNQPHGNTEAIKDGKLRKGKLSYEIYGDILMDFKEIFKEYNHVYFVRALIYIVNKGAYKHKEDFKRFVKHRFDLIGCANVDQYLKMFEQILNFHRRGGKLSIVEGYSKK